MHLGTPQQYEGLMFSHHTSSIHAGPTVCLYKRLPSMREKVEAQIALAENIRAVDQRGVVEKFYLPTFYRILWEIQGRFPNKK